MKKREYGRKKSKVGEARQQPTRTCERPEKGELSFLARDSEAEKDLRERYREDEKKAKEKEGEKESTPGRTTGSRPAAGGAELWRTSGWRELNWV